MYVVKNNRGQILMSIDADASYDKVRNALRRYIRKLFSANTRIIRDMSKAEGEHYNPAHTNYGYKIVRI